MICLDLFCNFAAVLFFSFCVETDSREKRFYQLFQLQIIFASRGRSKERERSAERNRDRGKERRRSRDRSRDRERRVSREFVLRFDCLSTN